MIQLTEIIVATTNLDYSSQGGTLYNKDKTVLIRHPEGAASGGVIIPRSVTSIGGAAFYGCTGLTSATIPDSVTSIGNSAFLSCNSLSDAYFLGDAPTMGTNVFSSTPPDFEICYTSEATGFTTPTWESYPAAACACLDAGDGTGDACDEYTVYGTIDPVIPATVEVYSTTCGLTTMVGTTTTDESSGYYAVSGLESGNFLVVPIASGYSFVPVSSAWVDIPQGVIQSFDFTSTAD